MALYRDRLRNQLRAFDVVKALASFGGAGGWLSLPAFHWVWAAIIAGAQAIEALKHAFPVAKLHHGAAGLTVALETMYIEAEAEWMPVDAGQVSSVTIIARRKRLQKQRVAETRRYFPDGLRLPNQLLEVAKDDAKAYFEITFGDGA